MGNVKLFILMGAGAVFLYVASHELISHKHIKYTGPPPTPTIRFVPAGTPGAKTFQEFQQENLERTRRRYSR